MRLTLLVLFLVLQIIYSHAATTCENYGYIKYPNYRKYCEAMTTATEACSSKQYVMNWSKDVTDNWCVYSMEYPYTVCSIEQDKRQPVCTDNILNVSGFERFQTNHTAEELKSYILRDSLFMKLTHIWQDISIMRFLIKVCEIDVQHVQLNLLKANYKRLQLHKESPRQFYDVETAATAITLSLQQCVMEDDPQKFLDIYEFLQQYNNFLRGFEAIEHEHTNNYDKLSKLSKEDRTELNRFIENYPGKLNKF
jgi:hypothetical protein